MELANLPALNALLNATSAVLLTTGYVQIRRVLISHIVLAALIGPLAIVTLVHALRERFDRHRRIARWTLPLWLYVSVTGIIVYVMLYVM